MQWIILRANTGSGSTITAQMYPQTAYLFDYRPLLIMPGQTLSYKLQYKEITSTSSYDTSGYTYSVAAIIPSSTAGYESSSSTGMDDSSTAIESSTGAFNLSWLDARTIPWLGTYQTDSTCVTSADCCCSVGNMIASPYSTGVTGIEKLS
jgi:hypothetical protein